MQLLPLLELWKFPIRSILKVADLDAGKIRYVSICWWICFPDVYGGLWGNLMCFLSFKVGDITRTRRPPPILQDPAQTVFCKVVGWSDCRCINLGQLEWNRDNTSVFATAQSCTHMFIMCQVWGGLHGITFRVIKTVLEKVSLRGWKGPD